MAKNRFSILANLDSSDLDDDLQPDTTNQFEEADSADSQPEEESKRRRSDSAKSTAAPSVRYLEKVAEFADMNERDIPNLLIRETVREGLVTDHNRKNSRTLHLSDNIIVISKFKGKVESFRNPLVGVWRGDQSATPDADVKTLDTSYFFFQDGEFCFFGGIENKKEGTAELGFGKQYLGDTHNECYFQMVSIRSSPSKPTTVAPCRMNLEKFLSRATVSMQSETNDQDWVSISTGAASRASTVYAGPVRSIQCHLDGKVVTVPILRCLRVSGPAAASRSVRSWFEYDVAQTMEQRPPFSFKELQAALAACALPLPQFSGRWRLEEVGDWPGFSAYTIIAVPRPDATAAAGRSGSVECMVVALQSNDEQEWQYETFLVGRGRVDDGGAGGGCRITATLRRVRLRAVRFASEQRLDELETMQGTQDRILLSSGKELSRLRVNSTPTQSAEDFVWSKEEAAQSEATAHLMVRQMVPEKLDFAQAVQAGDVVRVNELLSTQLQDLNVLVRIKSRLGNEAMPIVAASVCARPAMVELLLAEHITRRLPLDPWTLACAGARSQRAEAELLKRLAEDSELRTAVCPSGHVLRHIKMCGCTLVEVAVLAGGNALARKLVAQGCCEHTLATAVQSGDAHWLEANADQWKARVNDHFKKGGVTAESWRVVKGLTPLILAAAQRDLKVVQCLLRHRANPFICRKGKESTAINYAHKYDHNVEKGFPVLRAILDAAKMWREEGKLPADWAGALERCAGWKHATHPGAWSLIEDFEGQFGHDQDVLAAVGSGGGEDDPPDDGSFEDSDFKFSSLQLCLAENFERGLRLEQYIGLPARTDHIHAMMQEHMNGIPFDRKSGQLLRDCKLHNRNDPDTNFPPSIVFPDSEWNFVLEGNDEYSIRDIVDRKAMIPERVSGSLMKLMEEARKNYPDLTIAEVIALRLWTGPMHKIYAIFFRSICICDKEACKISRTWPPEPSIYVTTMHAINSGVVKLARQQATMQLPQVLYRGCSHPSAAVLNAYLARDRAAMVEPCVLAFSQDRKVGVRYAKHFPGVLLELDAVQGSFIWGADVEWLTQFPMQYEVLFPALTQLDIVDGPLTKQEKNGISVYKARVVLNAYSCTLEELSLQSSMHKSLECQSLVEGISATDASVKDQRQLVVREDGNGTCCGKEKDI